MELSLRQSLTDDDDSLLTVRGSSAERVVSEPLPAWEEDDYEDQEDYEKKLVRLVEDKFEESYDFFSRKKMRWAEADKLIELEHILDTLMDKHPEKTRMPYLPQAIEEWLAVRHADPLRPSAGARQGTMDQIVGAGNYFMEQELDHNYWNLLRMRVGIDQLKCGIGFVKVTVDPYRKGIFGQDGEHRLERFDPRYVWPDRFATSWNWRDMKYLILATPMDIEDIRQLWPDKGLDVPPDSRFSIDRLNDYTADAVNSGGTRGRIVSAADDDTTPTQRPRALVLECYIKDSRQRLVPIRGADGEPLRDENGEIRTEYVARYPNGRLIVVCNGVLLLDVANPWNHGQTPLVPFPERVTDGLFSYSPLDLLDMVDRKLNLIVREAYGNLRVHMNSPWVVDRNAFTKPSQYDQITQDRKLVFIVRPNSRIMRLPPGELPQQLFVFIEYLKDVFDQVLGVTKIDRGQLEKGSQLSAESVIELQGAAGQRQVMKKTIDVESVKWLGHLLFENIRQFYPSQMKVTVKDPSGVDRELSWDNTQIKNSWDVKIDAGNTGGAQASAQQRAVTLYDKGVIDNEEVLTVLNWPSAGKVLARMRDERTRLAQMGFVKEALRLGVVSKA